MEIDGTEGHVYWSSGQARVCFLDGAVEEFDNSGQNACMEVLRKCARVVSGIEKSPDFVARDCRSFVKAINGAYLSSQGVHALPDAMVSEYTEDGRLYTEVDDIGGTIRSAYARGVMFSDVDSRYSFRSSHVNVESLSQFAWDNDWEGTLKSKVLPDTTASFDLW